MSDSSITAFIKASSLLEGLSADSLTFLQNSVTLREYPANQTILLEDAWGNTVYILMEGWVKVRRATKTGTATLAILGADTFFGEMAVLDQAPRSTDVVSMTPIKTFVMSAKDFKMLLPSQGKLCYRLAQQMARRLRQTNQAFYLQEQSAPVRFVAALVQIADVYGTSLGQGSREIVNIPLQDLADLADITLEDARRVMDRFMKQQMIEVNAETQLMRLNQYQKLSEAVQMV